MAILDRLRDALEAGRAATADADRALRYERANPRKSIGLLLTCSEVGSEAAESAAFANMAARRKRRPLLITSAPDFVALRSPGLVCEHLPALDDLLEATGEPPEVVRLYVLRRLLLILEKWCADECHWRGQHADELVLAATQRQELIFRKIDFRKW